MKGIAIRLEMVAFLGPSGWGKTTTLLMIAGVYQPTAGAIYFADRRVDHLHPRGQQQRAALARAR